MLGTDDEVAVDPRSVVDLDVARLGRVRDPGDVHGLAARRDRELDRLGLGRARRLRVRHPTPDADALERDAKVGVDCGRLRDRRLPAEGDGDIFGGAATAGDGAEHQQAVLERDVDRMMGYALQLGVAEDSPYADIRVVDNVDLQIHGSSECMSRRRSGFVPRYTCPPS